MPNFYFYFSNICFPYNFIFFNQRSLYNDEMLKKTQKYDEKLTEHRETINMMEIKLTQFEQHNEKLAKQNHLTSEMKLKYEEMVKENEFMRSKIRFMEINGGMQIKNSVGINRMQSSMAQINGASLGMEDEPGEEFNNTYLKDLKRGGSEVSLDLYSTSELQKRNSMYPQHMRGSYAMLGMDRTIGEQEMKVRNEGNCNRMTKLKYISGWRISIR